MHWIRVNIISLCSWTSQRFLTQSIIIWYVKHYTKYVICGVTLDWFESYVSERNHYVNYKCNKFKSISHYIWCASGIVTTSFDYLHK